MKRIELIELLSNQDLDLNKSKAKLATDIIFDKIIDAVASKEGVEIRGFGSFTNKRKESRVGINPRTGERTQVPAKNTIFFKPGKDLKKQVNNL